MQRAGNPTLRLHLGDDRNRVPDIFLAHCCLGIGFGGHRCGWRNRIDCNDFTGGVGNMGARLIAVNGDHFPGHNFSS